MPPNWKEDFTPFWYPIHLGPISNAWQREAHFGKPKSKRQHRYGHASIRRWFESVQIYSLRITARSYFYLFSKHDSQTQLQSEPKVLYAHLLQHQLGKQQRIRCIPFKRNFIIFRSTEPQTLTHFLLCKVASTALFRAFLFNNSTKATMRSNSKALSIKMKSWSIPFYKNLLVLE